MTQPCPNCGTVHDVSVFVSGQLIVCSCGIRFEVRRTDVRSPGNTTLNAKAPKEGSSASVLAPAGANGSIEVNLASSNAALEHTVTSSNTVKAVPPLSKPEVPGYELEELGKGRNILLFGDIEKNFYTHVIFATDDMIAKRPELLRRFLRGWFKTVAFMKQNKDFAVKSGAKVVQVRESIVSKVYDTQIGGFSTDGSWDVTSLDVIRNSLQELEILDFVPEAKTLYNDTFVPVKF